MIAALVFAVLQTDAQAIAVLADGKAPLAQREQAMALVRERHLAKAAPVLVRIGTLPDNHENDALSRLRGEAIVTLFAIGDPHAKDAAETMVQRSYGGVSPVRGWVMDQLGRMTDAPSLEFLVHGLSYDGYKQQEAARGLFLRQEPAARNALVAAFAHESKWTDAFGTIYQHFVQTGDLAAMRALFHAAAERRGMRDVLVMIAKEWVQNRGAAALADLETIAKDPKDPGASRLVRAFLACARAPECRLPGDPRDGEPQDGRALLEVTSAQRSRVWQGRPGPPAYRYVAVLRAKRGPLIPYMFATHDFCSRLVAGRFGKHAFAAGDQFALSTEPGGVLMFAEPWPKREKTRCTTTREADEAELIFFVGETKYRFSFRYKMPPDGPAPPVP